MNRFSKLPVSIAFLFFTTMGLNHAAADPADGWAKTYKLNSLYKAEIRNKGGEKLGVIEDFVMDARSGRIAFVVFSHAGMAGLGQKVKIVPFEFFSFNETERYFILDKLPFPSRGGKNARE